MFLRKIIILDAFYGTFGKIWRNENFKHAIFADRAIGSFDVEKTWMLNEWFSFRIWNISGKFLKKKIEKWNNNPN